MKMHFSCEKMHFSVETAGFFAICDLDREIVSAITTSLYEKIVKNKQGL